VVGNLNSYSGSGALLQQVRTALDSGGVYTSVVTDVKSTYSLTAITELKTATSPGNLWVYSPGVQTAFKILGPGGVALPAVTSFIIPAVTNGGGGVGEPGWVDCVEYFFAAGGYDAVHDN